MKGRILYQSANLNTYTNLVVAMCNAYPDIEKICISFVDVETNEEFIDDLQASLSTYSNTNMYKKAARINLTSESIKSNDPNCYLEWDVIDVSALSKENAINIVAATLENSNIKVCTLHWLVRFEKHDGPWILTKDNHKYSNLLSEGALSKLYKNYFQKKVVIRMFAGMFVLLIGIVLVKIFIPTFNLPEGFINFFSLLIGAGGLYLAAESLKDK